MKNFIAIDPGREKCGVAVMDGEGGVAEKAIIPRSRVGEKIKELLERHPGVDEFAVGGGTGGGELLELLKKNFPGLRATAVEEKNTTLLARDRYFLEHPEKRYLRVFPLSLFLRQPEVDAHAAVVIGERYLKGGKESG